MCTVLFNRWNPSSGKRCMCVCACVSICLCLSSDVSIYVCVCAFVRVTSDGKAFSRQSISDFGVSFEGNGKETVKINTADI